jgi:uncharacterized protein YbaP (TraB family)
MKLRNAGLLVVLLAATAACKKSEDRAARGVAPVTQGGSADPWSGHDPMGRPLFWAAEKDGKTTYLLGTMHVGVDAEARLPAIVWQKLGESPTFAMETDLSGVANHDFTRTDGKTLDEELGPERWKQFEQAVGPRNAAAMKTLKPMIAATYVAIRGMPTTEGMDRTLHRRAAKQYKQIVFLESADMQVAVFEKWMTTRALTDMLDDLEGTEQRAKEMVAAYMAGDGDKITAIVESERERWKAKGRPDAEFEESMTDMLYKRNASWIEPIVKLHAAGGGFIAVGAAHLVGPRSVLELLEKQGFTVTRLTP